MRFFDVHHVEGGAVAIRFIDFVERGNLPAKRRSSVTAEHQHHRFGGPEGGELYGTFLVLGG
jgi:hypothetical protein